MTTMDLTDETIGRMLHTARHLTGAEMDRLLHRYDLHAGVRRLLAHYEAENGWYLYEMYAEQMSERGCATRYYTRLETHHNLHPVYGPDAPPPVSRWRDNDDEIPF